MLYGGQTSECASLIELEAVASVRLDLAPFLGGRFGDAGQDQVLISFDEQRSPTEPITPIVKTASGLVKVDESKRPLDRPEDIEDMILAMAVSTSFRQQGHNGVAIIARNRLASDLPCLAIPAQNRAAGLIDNGLCGNVIAAERQNRRCEEQEQGGVFPIEL